MLLVVPVVDRVGSVDPIEHRDRFDRQLIGLLMNDKTSRKGWGAARVAFVARLETIKADIRQCHPLTMIYDRHRAVLGISYPSFCRLVTRYAGDARLNPRRASQHEEAPNPAPRTSPPPAAAALAPPPPTTLPEGSSADVRPQSPARPIFHHHGIVQEGEVERLFGPGYFPKRGV